jgi:CheY-like chemotaxis protein
MTTKVLVAEDKDDSRKLIRSMLEIYGYEVVEAENGADAVARSIVESPDVILMDLAMPVMDGVEATKKIRGHFALRKTPIICLTAYGDLYANDARKAGADAVMPKPIDFRELDPLITHYVRNPGRLP